jgi:hypothetical protein
MPTSQREPGSAPFGARPYPLAYRHARAPAGIGQLFGDNPPAKVTAFQGPKHTLEVMASKALGPRGEQSVPVRQFTEWVVRHLEPKDYLGEIIAIRNVFLQRSPFNGAPLFRYMNDPRHVELLKDPERMVTEINLYGSTIADCDELTLLAGTMGLQLGREVEWVALGFFPDSLSHVGVRVREPKSGQWIWLDAVAGPREREAAQRAKNVAFWSLD